MFVIISKMSSLFAESQYLSTGMTRSLDSQGDRKIVAVIGHGNSGKTCLTKLLTAEDVGSSLAVHRHTLDESRYITKAMPSEYLLLIKLSFSQSIFYHRDSIIMIKTNSYIDRFPVWPVIHTSCT